MFCHAISTVLFAIVAEKMHLLNFCCFNREIGYCKLELVELQILPL